MLPFVFYHRIQLAKLVEVFAKCQKHVGYHCAFLVNIWANIYGLVQNGVVAVNVWLHLTAENCAVLLNLDIKLPLGSVNVFDFFRKLYFFLLLNHIFPLFHIINS